MTDDETRDMLAHGITCVVRETFHFQGHRYERLSDAISYAQRQQGSTVTTRAVPPLETAGPDGEHD